MYMQQQTNPSGYPAGQATASTEYPFADDHSEITRSDFARVDLKGLAGHYYFSYLNRWLGIEICLEPCLNGFDIAMYDKQNSLIGKKICTDLPTDLKESIFKDKGKHNSEELIQKEMLKGTQERSSWVWDKTLKIANEMLRSYRNQVKLKDWKIIPDFSPLNSSDTDEIRRQATKQIDPWKGTSGPYMGSDTGGLGPNTGGRFPNDAADGSAT